MPDISQYLRKGKKALQPSDSKAVQPSSNKALKPQKDK
jgi:hypothetical protein